MRVKAISCTRIVSHEEIVRAQQVSVSCRIAFGIVCLILSDSVLVIQTSMVDVSPASLLLQS